MSQMRGTCSGLRKFGIWPHHQYQQQLLIKPLTAFSWSPQRVNAGKGSCESWANTLYVAWARYMPYLNISITRGSKMCWIVCALSLSELILAKHCRSKLGFLGKVPFCRLATNKKFCRAFSRGEVKRNRDGAVLSHSTGIDEEWWKSAITPNQARSMAVQNVKDWYILRGPTFLNKLKV